MRAAWGEGAAKVDHLQGRPPSVGEFTNRGQFEVLKELHNCGTGSVHLARVKDRRHERTPVQVVLKRRKVPELGRAKDMLNEYEVMKRLNHPNIIRCLGYFWEFQSQSLFIVLEYAKRGDLHSELQARKQIGQHFTDEEVCDICGQILLGLAHIHSKGIVHRDIKSLNLFLTDTGMVKLGDFGVSRQMSDQTMFLNSFYGTPLYLSPEIIEGRSYSWSTDIWSVGVVVYELLSLQPPFHGPSLQDVISAVLRAKPAPLPRSRPAELCNIVGEMLSREASRRPSAENLLKQLERASRQLSNSKASNSRRSDAKHAASEDFHPTSASDQIARSPSSTSASQEKDDEKNSESGKVVRVRKRRPSGAGCTQVPEGLLAKPSSPGAWH
eukprot:TRINITY_DN17418_c0_g1_i1.p1 TRINITY_DN17418_c0_g1~~TRINITY_DN17418_c0_g1_i1.p1  ORF type:complete len:383 (-),score=50.87 TRINITY_DN17418_c0_g1_i1:46-1194(-)